MTTAENLLHNSRFLRALRGEKPDATPVWLMRQAGRYMAEYRQLREQYTILQIIKTPELACEVTMQPINAFDLDAAIIFSDILPLLEVMGLELDFIHGEGPVIYNPLQTHADIAALQVNDPNETLHFTLDAIRLARQQLDARGVPLIGFSGAPFTLAAYAIEGGSSRHFLKARQLMQREPKSWHLLMEKLSEMVGRYLLAQVNAGVHALQLFDSWVGILSPDDYQEYVMPYTRHALEVAKQGGVPVIHFGTGTGGMLELIQQSGGDVIGIDWATPLDHAWDRLGKDAILQGNLDPVTLLAPWDVLEARTKAVLDRAAGHDGYIFNLGHGILPQTPVENVRQLVDFVHAYTKR